MGRKRKNLNDRCLPPFVYRGKSSFELRSYQGKGLKMTCVKLCPLNAPVSEIWAKYEETQGKPVYTLKWLLELYKNSIEFKEKAAKTQIGQEQQISFLCRYKSAKTGKLFCEIKLNNFTRGLIKRYLDARKADGSPVSANREKALISKSWNWALERDLIKWVNPCIGVSRNTEASRTRYVTDHEYEIAYKLASEYLSYLPIMMEMAYLCRMRRGEILTSLKSQVEAEGFHTKRLKGSNDTLTLWTSRLRDVIISAKNLSTKTYSVYLIYNKHGQKISESCAKSAWTRLKKKMINAGIAPFNFHDLKAKGVSDFEGNKQDASGHKTLAQVAVYDRKKKKVKATK